MRQPAVVEACHPTADDVELALHVRARLAGVLLGPATKTASEIRWGVCPVPPRRHHAHSRALVFVASKALLRLAFLALVAVDNVLITATNE
eukprot:scaffold13513_cov130-Isochrysis_galbana.AAC.5